MNGSFSGASVTGTNSWGTMMMSSHNIRVRGSQLEGISSFAFCSSSTLASSRIQLLCALVHRGLSLGASSSVRSGVCPRPNNSAPASSSARFFHTSRIERWPNVSVELKVRTLRPHTSVMMAGRGGGGGDGRRPSFLGPGTAANSAGGVVEGGGGSQRDFPPVSRQQGGTSSHSASPREGSNQFTSSWQQRGGRGNYNAGEGRPGHENESGSSTGRGRRSMDPIEALGRCMTGILRHQAANYNLEIRNDGFVLVSDLLKKSKKTAAGKLLSSHSEDDVRKAVEVDSKQRFGLKEENGVLYIRAVQGHTIKTVESEHLLTPIAAPSEVPVCVHGTSEKAWKIIREDGLRPMTRNHIHFATGLPKEDGVISGMRVTSQVLIYLNVEKAIEDGIKLYISEKKVVLTEGIDGVIPPKYFKRVLKFQADGTELELKLPHDESVANIAAEPKAEPRRTQITTLPKNLVCVYCTNEKEMTNFWHEGLKVSTDKFIHFATVLPTEESSTRGAGKQVAHPVYIHLNVDKAVEAGMKLYLQDKELVTEGTDGVISKDFFKRVYKKRPTGTEINLYPPHRPKPSNNATDA